MDGEVLDKGENRKKKKGRVRHHHHIVHYPASSIQFTHASASRLEFMYVDVWTLWYMSLVWVMVLWREYPVPCKTRVIRRGGGERRGGQVTRLIITCPPVTERGPEVAQLTEITILPYIFSIRE